MTLLEYMHESGLTQQDMAELLDVSQPTVSRWMCGAMFPDWVAHIPRIYKVTGGKVTANDFVKEYLDVEEK